TEIDMVARLVGKQRRRAPTLDLLICRLIASHGNRLVREIWQSHQNVVELFLYSVESSLALRYLLTDLTHLLAARFGLLLLTALHQRADLLAFAISQGLKVVDFANVRASFAFEFCETVQHFGRKTARL